MRVSNEDRLAANGCELPLGEFQARLMDAFSNLYRAWTVDELLVHPRDAIKLCDHMRGSVGAPDLPDDLILRVLMGMRKHP